MKQPKTALFDFDGVVVDTEPIYDLFWNDAAKRYGLGIDNFADIIKGTTLPYILEKYFFRIYGGVPPNGDQRIHGV